MSDVFSLSPRKRIDSYVEYGGVSGSGPPDVLDITEACQLCGWALNGSLFLISHSSFTMTPLFSWYYSTPGGSLCKSDKYGQSVCFLRAVEENAWTRTHVTAELFVGGYGDGFNAQRGYKFSILTRFLLDFFFSFTVWFQTLDTGWGGGCILHCSASHFFFQSGVCTPVTQHAIQGAPQRGVGGW